MISPDQLLDLKVRNPVNTVAGQWVKLRSAGRRGWVGPCPLCSPDPQSRSATRFECTADKWVCAVCEDGGDVVKLMRKREGVTFPDAVDRLGGAREEAPTPEIAKRRGRADCRAADAPGDRPARYPDNYTTAALRDAYEAGWRAQRRADAYEVFARERERKRLFTFWEAARAGDHVAYLRRRGVDIPPGAKLRTHPDMPYFADGKENEPLRVCSGPAMLAPILMPAPDRDVFAGLHITWLDPEGPKGKRVIIHPHTGEVMPSKKVRGSKRGGYIPLGGVCDPFDDRAPWRRLIAGEGIETVLAVYTALSFSARDLRGTLFRSSADLGNLAGRSLETVAHPTLKTPGGRAQRVPGPTPDLGEPAMPVPDTIDELVLLGDGDSEPFMTRHALARAAARNAREGRTVRQRFAPAGVDFDDMMPSRD
ncbi:CHC2 zinc finger domain-containing protein [Rhodopseudomonas sp. B29]|uniref:DUF7146 domain-containing protein n=1 Tax=Rhodopseudomonas sp. B29 TaxID=95607 RepID=UPI00034D3B22|nr:CHC2 zinc finger domain-containing protein [Rhodopseudomonas sp. B29]